MGGKGIINFVLMDIILAIVFIGLILSIFELHRFFLIGEVIILAILLIISFISLVAILNGIRWGWGILSLSFAIILIDLLGIYFVTRVINTTFFITMVLSAIGFILAVISIGKKKTEEPEAPKVTTTTFTPGKYIASKTGTTYHSPRCDWAKKIKKKNQVWFDDEAEAKKNFKPHSCLK